MTQEQLAGLQGMEGDEARWACRLTGRIVARGRNFPDGRRTMVDDTRHFAISPGHSKRTLRGPMKGSGPRTEPPYTHGFPSLVAPLHRAYSRLHAVPAGWAMPPTHATASAPTACVAPGATVKVTQRAPEHRGGLRAHAAHAVLDGLAQKD